MVWESFIELQSGRCTSQNSSELKHAGCQEGLNDCNSRWEERIQIPGTRGSLQIKAFDKLMSLGDPQDIVGPYRLGPMPGSKVTH
jgi:hypothetical protein